MEGERKARQRSMKDIMISTRMRREFGRWMRLCKSKVQKVLILMKANGRWGNVKYRATAS